MLSKHDINHTSRVILKSTIAPMSDVILALSFISWGTPLTGIWSGLDSQWHVFAFTEQLSTFAARWRRKSRLHRGLGREASRSQK